jgi:Raf kinase inhibitor-like YbhB/YbcL family protein
MAVGSPTEAERGKGACVGQGHRVRGRADLRVVAPAVLALLLSGCGLIGRSAPLQQDLQGLTVSSPAFSRLIPREYTCRGSGQSPPIYWSGAPAGTKSLALVVDDSGAPITPYVYWVVFDISPGTTEIAAGQLPQGARTADNSRGKAAYDPPCPAASHKYRFTVYALNARLSLHNGASLVAAWTAIASHAIDHGRFTPAARP